MHLRRTAAIVVGLALSTGGCSSAPRTPDVAHVPSTGPASTAGSKAGGIDRSGQVRSIGDDDRRPVIRVNDSEGRVAALWNAYNSCLLANGASRPKAGGMAPALGGTSDSPGVLVDYPAPAKAQSACLRLEPRQAPELNASSNPEFHDQSLKYIACMRDKGLYVKLLNGKDLSWTFESGRAVPDNQVEISARCLQKAFSGT